MLYFIGLGLSINHLTLEAIDALRNADKVYIDTYTNIVPDFSLDKLVGLVGEEKEFVMAKRELLEGKNIYYIVEEASKKNIAILVPGDPFIATTHDAIRVEALRRGVKIRVVNGLSIYSLAPSRTGLQAYRFGKTVTLVYPDYFKPYSTIETIYDNLDRNLHTLLLLDLKIEENKAMTIPEAIDILIELDERRVLENIIGVGLAQLGSSMEKIVADRLADLKKYAYPSPPHSIIIVAKPHPVELDNLYYVCGLPEHLYRRYSVSKTYP
ncbi:diphthine synthase [Staphylothermus hellenicus]|uniref:Diphthine synthase n=1 Tax=Staphylothermus hellenicus (strain DSM 12710 / JCM 10830 / BK20S6-10-b1 / P8) TaxID=591019 RepID=D7DB79_STAHD|nr:diphthine synthase [Staphylothermus hellenicus]ADI31426.1 diphthine synthase [Staphylothermus hellenicus DSM 12710]